MSKEVEVRYPPILGILGAVLVVMKLLGEIDLAWIWVLAPFWAPWALMLIIILVPVVIIGVVGLFALGVAYVLEWAESLGRKFRRRSHSPQMRSRYKR